MSQRYLGGIVTASPTAPTITTASGEWTLSQQFQYNSTWPKSSTEAITRSLRFRSSASAYLSRTPSVAGNSSKYTISMWVKIGALQDEMLFAAGASSANQTYIRMYGGANQAILWETDTSSTFNWYVQTNALFRDPAAWYHFVFTYDSSLSGVTNQAKIYVNGVQASIGSSGSTGTNSYVNTTVAHYFGRHAASSLYYDGYLTEINFIDGQALTPAYFGYTDVNGIWQPSAYTGTYGTNGFRLSFSDNTSTTTLGYDTSGNGNNWTTNNISLTAGSTYDSMTDVPTLTSATAANYAVLNPLDKDTNLTFSDGNLTATGYNAGGAASFGLTSGKWYWEVTLVDVYNGNWGLHGVSSGKPNSYVSGYTGYPTGAGVYLLTSSGGGTWAGGSAVTASTTWANGDVVGFAFDATNLTLDVYRNNTKIGTTLTVPSGAIYPSVYQNGVSGDTSATAYNFGQRPFTYTPPSGYVALNTYNLPASTISNGATVMAATTYTGTGANATITNTVNGVSFKPDFIWFKNRASAYSHLLYDSIRGTSLYLSSNTTGAEISYSLGLTAFNSNGFSVGTDPASNESTKGIVAWQWQAGQGTTSSNTSGSITSTVSVNATAGFSIVTYTGTGANATVGHGLGVAPSMIIVKDRVNTFNWAVWHTSLTSAAYALQLNTTIAQTNAFNYWNSTLPTSSVFSLGTDNGSNKSSETYVAYCWAAVKGFSAFGSYTGNGSTDGPFIYTGFRPRYLLIKNSSIAASWEIIDTSRDPYNVAYHDLYAESSSAESTGTNRLDIVSNGFKVRDSNTFINGSGNTVIYAAFAENPFSIARAR